MRHTMRFSIVLPSCLAVSCLISPPARAAELFTEIVPCRIVDTRTSGFGGVLQSGVKRNFTVTGGVTVSGFPACTIPNTARAVALNVIAVGPTAAGFLALWPSSASTFGASTLNVDPGQGALANGALVKLNFGTTTTEPSLSVIYGTAVSATTHVVIDVTGYFSDPQPPFYVLSSDQLTGAVLGDEDTAVAAYGEFSGVEAFAWQPGGVGVVGRVASTGDGVHGEGSKYGVWGKGLFGLRGVGGTASANYGDQFAGKAGAYGDSSDGVGVYGTSDSNVGVAGVSKTKWGIYGAGGAYAGYFDGNVHVNGTLSKAAGSFKIDHPLDPANKFLSHSFVESPDMMNVYDGVVALDRRGRAVVELPDWFEALNSDFRYQLTCIGAFAPVYVSREIAEHRFEIAGGRRGLKVSWQVTGIRHDPYAVHHRVPVEEDKAADERGRYLDPVDYGQPASRGISGLQDGKPPL